MNPAVATVSHRRVNILAIKLSQMGVANLCMGENSSAPFYFQQPLLNFAILFKQFNGQPTLGERMTDPGIAGNLLAQFFYFFLEVGPVVYSETTDLGTFKQTHKASLFAVGN